MRLPDIIMLGTRMFTTRTLRTFLTIGGVSVGIGAVLFLVSLGYGMQNVILGQITTADSLLSIDVAPGGSGIIPLDDAALKRFAEQPQTQEIARLKQLSGQITLNDLTSDATISAIDAPLFRLDGITVDYGELFTDSNDRPMVISSALAQLFDVNAELILSSQVKLVLFIQRIDDNGFEDTEVATQDEPFTVVGVIRDDTASYAYIPLATISSTPFESFDLVKIKGSTQEDAHVLRDTITDQGFSVSAVSDVIDQARQIFKIVQIVLGLFGLIALIVSAIGMFNTMTIALLERTNEIGIMRSLGVSRGDIRILFLFEATIMGLMGGVGGVVLGFLLGEFANIGINVLARSFGGRPLDLFYQPLWFVVVIILFSTIVGFLTGLFPSRRAAKMDPLEALRYK